MNIDYTKLGYRWRGYYSDSVAYGDKDVVYKEGAAFYFDLPTNTFKIFARGQEEAISKGELIVGDQIDPLKGFPGEILFVQNGEAKFRHPIDRNGTRVVGLATNSLKGNVMYPSDQFMTFVMSDGSVRGIGRTAEGYLGGSNDKDEAHGAMVPVRVNFPLGTPPIVKAFKGPGSSFFVDAEGTLWSGGNQLYTGCNGLGPGREFDGNEGYTESGIRNVSATTDIGDDPIDKVFSFYDYYSGHHCHYALSTTGKVYSWGHDPSNILGHRRVLEGDNTYSAMLIEFTKDTPIVDIGSDAHAVTGMIDVDGNLWTVGSGGYNWHGNNTYGKFLKVQGLQSKVVQFQGDSGEGHWNHGHYLGSALLLDDGRLYARGNGFDQVGWGTPGLSTSNAYRDDRHLMGKDISFFAFKHGAYAQMIAQRFDGSWMFRGANRWNFSPKHEDTFPSSADDWADNYPRMASNYYNSNLIKYKFHGGNISEGAIGLHSDGRAFVDGINRVGQRGLGMTDHWYLDDPSGAGSYIERLPDFFVPINEKIIDIDMAGYHYHWYNHSYYDYTTYYFLTENGNVYATGSSNYYKNGMYPSSNANTPNRIIF